MALDRIRIPKVSLVTGASAGIGRALAIELARRGSDVVLLARRGDRLREVAEACRAAGGEHGITAHVLARDLSAPDAPAALVSELAARGLAVELLVNNAGWGQGRRFLESEWEQHRAFLQVMLSGVVELTHRLIPPMVERGYGRVLQVASLAAQLPGTPGDALYTPTKAFLVKFAQGLNAELAGTGVRVTALCPGYTLSEFHDVSGTRKRVAKLPGFMWTEAEPVARLGIDAALRGDGRYTPGFVNRLLHGVMAAVPDPLILSVWAKRPTRR
jgi:short-subunit dehydrogenase